MRPPNDLSKGAFSWSARRGLDLVIDSSHEDHVLVRIVRISHRADAYGI